MALKSCPKCKKSPNLVTLQASECTFTNIGKVESNKMDTKNDPSCCLPVVEREHMVHNLFNKLLCERDVAARGLNKQWFFHTFALLKITPFVLGRLFDLFDECSTLVKLILLTAQMFFVHFCKSSLQNRYCLGNSITFKYISNKIYICKYLQIKISLCEKITQVWTGQFALWISFQHYLNFLSLFCRYKSAAKFASVMPNFIW